MAAPAELCPAASIGREIAALVDAVNEADRAWLDAAPADSDAAQGRFDALERRLDDRIEAISFARASSLPGALAQAMVASCAAMGDELPSSIAARFNRLMVSVVGVLEARGGVSREAMAGEYFMRRELDATRAADDPVSLPDAEIVDACADAVALLAAYKAKDATTFDEPGTDDAEEAFYSEANRADEIAKRVCGLRALTMAGVRAKVGLVLANRDVRDIERANQLAQSIADDLARGLLRSREDGA